MKFCLPLQVCRPHFEGYLTRKSLDFFFFGGHVLDKILVILSDVNITKKLEQKIILRAMLDK